MDASGWVRRGGRGLGSLVVLVNFRIGRRLWEGVRRAGWEGEYLLACDEGEGAGGVRETTEDDAVGVPSY